MIEAATDLFHRHGIDGVAVDAVLTASATGKSQLYHYFGSKDGLVRTVAERHRNAAAEGPLSAPISSWDDLENWLAVRTAAVAEHGCTRSTALGVLAATRSEDNDPVREIIDDAFAATRRPLVKFFRRKLGSKSKNGTREADALATLCLATVEGAALLARSAGRKRPMTRSTGALVDLLKRRFGDA